MQGLPALRTRVDRQSGGLVDHEHQGIAIEEPGHYLFRSSCGLGYRGRPADARSAMPENPPDKTGEKTGIFSRLFGRKPEARARTGAGPGGGHARGHAVAAGRRGRRSGGGALHGHGRLARHAGRPQGAGGTRRRRSPARRGRRAGGRRPEGADPPRRAGACAPARAEPKGWWQRLTGGLRRTSSQLSESVTGLFTKRRLDAATLEDLEDALVQADLGVETAMRISRAVGEGRYEKEISPAEVKAILAGEVERALEPVAKPLAIDRSRKPFVILMVGVNGSGKTTTIGKLAQKFRAAGPLGPARGRRHLPGGGHRAAQGVGRARRARRSSPASRAPTRRGSPSTPCSRRGSGGATSSSSTRPGACRTRRA